MLYILCAHDIARPSLRLCSWLSYTSLHSRFRFSGLQTQAPSARPPQPRTCSEALPLQARAIAGDSKQAICASQSRQVSSRHAKATHYTRNWIGSFGSGKIYI
jgi:hypothetical protein